MNKEKRNFRIKMHLACANDDLRPILSTIFFDNGYMIATDAHMMVKAKVSDYSSFEQEEIEKLNGKFLTKEVFKKLHSSNYVQVTDEGLKDVENNITYNFHTPEGKFPNYQSILPVVQDNIDEIGINPRLMKRLCTILNTTSSTNLTMKFHGKNRAITFSDNLMADDSLVALIMPVMLDN